MFSELTAASVPAVPQPDGERRHGSLQPPEAAGLSGEEGQDGEGLGAEQGLHQGAERCQAIVC